MSSTIFSVFLLLLAVQAICGDSKANESDATSAIQTDATRLSNPFKEVSFHGSSCHCAHEQCHCCVNVAVKKHNYHRNICVSARYVPKNVAIVVALTENQKQLISKTVSAHNPPPICVRVPDAPIISFCVRFHNLSVSGKKLHACIDLEAHVSKIPLVKLPFGCVNI